MTSGMIINPRGKMMEMIKLIVFNTGIYLG